ncbi:MAG TPA: hypothetical protein VKF32_07680 [Thermoanaerobaculia bacterium]|nr:hypothetical protein [Thermoanaerobaculia bacterium]
MGGDRKRRRRADAARTGQKPPAPSRLRSKWIWVGAAALLFVLQAWHRYPIVASVAGGRFDDPDAIYHARRVMRAIEEHALLPPVFDPLEAFPTGSRAVWPPLHDASLALVARIGGSTASSPARGMVLAAAVPLVEGVLALLAAVWLAKRAGGIGAAAPAAWIFVLTPILARRASYGDIDHNVTEVLGALLLSLAGSWATRQPGRPFGLVLGAFAWGAAVLVAIGFYTGLILSAGVVALALGAVDTLDSERRGSRSAVLGLGFAIAAALLPLFASLRVAPDPSDTWRLGPAYVLVLCIGAAGTGGLALALLRRAAGRAHRLAALAGVALGACVAALQPGRAWAAMTKALGFLGSRDPWLATIEEFRPLFRRNSELSKAMPSLLVGAVALVVFAAMWRRRRDLLMPLVGLAVPCAAFTLLALVQARFAGLAAAFAAAFSGAAWALTAVSAPARWAHRAALAAGFAWGAWFLLGMLDATFHGGEAPPEDTSLGEQAARAFVVVTKGRVPGDAGILAPWGAGHHLVRTTGFPVALTPFGSALPGFEESLRIFLEESPAKAVAALERLRLRWVVVPEPPSSILEAAQPLGLDPSGYFFGSDFRAFTVAGSRTLAARLYTRARPTPEDGEDDRKALARFRQIVDGSAPRRTALGVPLPRFRIFELR